MEPHVERVFLRGDTRFALASRFDSCSGKVDFIFGIRSCKAMEAAVGTLEKRAWQLLERTAASPISRTACLSLPQVANSEVVQSIIERGRR